MFRTIAYLDSIIYWSLVLIPFFVGIAPAPVSVFSGFFIAALVTKRIVQKKPLFASNAASFPFLAFFSVTCLSLVNSVSLGDSLKGGVLRLLQYGFIMLGIAQEVKDSRHLRLIVGSMAAGVVFASFDSLWQVAFGHDLVRHWQPEQLLGLIRAKGSFKDPNTLGVYLSAFTPVCAAFTLWYARGKARAAAFLLSAVVLGGIALTYSRPTLLAVFIALLFMGLVRRDRWLLSVLALMVVISPFITPKSVREWTRSVGYDPLRVMCNDDRIAIFKNALNMIRHNPVLGVGANTFMKNYQKYKESPEYRGVVTSDYCYAHNNFLHMAGETGLVGLGLFLWFLAALFMHAGRVYTESADPFVRVVSLAVTACLIAFLVNGLTESSLYSSRVAVVFWYLAGLQLCMGKWRYEK